MWRGQVASATRGRRGQRLFRDMKTALEAMPVRELEVGKLVSSTGCGCALGVLGEHRGLDMSSTDEGDPWDVGLVFDIARQLAAEIVFMNDEAFCGATDGERWLKMHDWVTSQISTEVSQ